ncbi:hypothetical protein MZ16F93_40260 [Escherichia coli]
MTANKKNQEFKIRKIRRNIEYSFRDSDRYFDLFIVFLVAGIVLWAVMHVIFDVCIDSWMADPKLLNFQYMWNVLMKVAYSALFDHGLASKSDQRFASIRSTGNLTFSTAF